MLALPLVGCASLPAPAPIGLGETVQATLAEGDVALKDGAWADIYALDVEAGQRLSIRHVSEDFDCYLIYIDPSGRQQDNDDFGGDLHSQIDITVERGGTARIIPAAYRAGEGGAYTLSVVSPDL
jgi:hypothetical protein